MLFTPASSAYTWAWRELSISHWPNTLLPVKSTDLTAGWVASFWVTLRWVATHRLTRLGSMPFSASTARMVRTVIAAGRMALLCGLTITALPVASAANRPG